MRFLLPLLVFLSFGYAQADQCYALTTKQVLSAAKHLPDGVNVFLYCPICSGFKDEVIELKNVQIDRREFADWFYLSLNDTPVDLAYTYILQDNKFINLASLVTKDPASDSDKDTYGCKNERVPDSVPLDFPAKHLNQAYSGENDFNESYEGQAEADYIEDIQNESDDSTEESTTGP